MLSNEWILNNKISGIKLAFFSLRNYKDDARSNKHKTLLLFWFLYIKGALEMIGLEEVKNVNRVLISVTVRNFGR